MNVDFSLVHSQSGSAMEFSPSYAKSPIEYNNFFLCQTSYYIKYCISFLPEHQVLVVGAALF